MATYANQQTITIKRTPKKEGEKYYHISQEILKSAMQKIKTVSALKLYLYLSKNSNTDWEYSKEHFREWSNLSTNIPKAAKQELINLGYLIPIEGSETKFIFYDSLELAKQDNEKQEGKTQENKKILPPEPFVF